MSLIFSIITSYVYVRTVCFDIGAVSLFLHSFSYRDHFYQPRDESSTSLATRSHQSRAFGPRPNDGRQKEDAGSEKGFLWKLAVAKGYIGEK